jgi:N4-gp56 family major capsid protein
MAVNTSNASGISQRTNVYAERQMLKHAGPVMVLDKFGLTKRMPKNKSTIIKFRRPVVFTASTVPLQEGITPTARAFSYEDVSASLKQYGEVVECSDVIEDTHEDPVLRDMAEISGENIGRTIEALNYGVLKAGTNVFYSNGTARTAVNGIITLAKQRAITRALKAQKSMKITKMLSGSPDYNTNPIEASYIGVAHTDLEADIRGMVGFTPVALYGQRSALCPEEIGSVEDVRYILSADLDSWADVGGSAGSMKSTTGTSADVYPVIYFGKEAYGCVALKGQGAVSPSIIPVGQKTKDDPLGQRGYVGWKTWHVCKILNELWMARLEVAVTAL